MEPMLPDKSIALFRARKGLERGDVVLVDHPEFGVVVKKIAAVSKRGRYALEGTSQYSTSARRLGSVDPDRVQGTMVMRLRWPRWLPRIRPPEEPV